MEKFKGTKGKWEVTPYQNVYCGINRVCTIGDLVKITEETQANAQLISFAPEMLNETEETVIDLKILRNQITDALKTNHLFEGMPELIDKWIERKEQLIKKATEL